VSDDVTRTADERRDPEEVATHADPDQALTTEEVPGKCHDDLCTHCEGLRQLDPDDIRIAKTAADARSDG
jgi:hypothetical protein